MNFLTLVGRIVAEPTIEELEDRKRVIVTIAVTRNYKNTNGEYETDFIPCILWNGIANSVTEYCHKGDVIGIKGRIERTGIEEPISVIVEKVSFISGSKKDDK